MHRRAFLLSASTTVLALMIFPAAAQRTYDYSKVPIEEAEKINHGLYVLWDYGTKLDRMAEHFASDPETVQKFDDLPPKISDVLSQSTEYWESIEDLIIIRQKLTLHVGWAVCDQIWWLMARGPIWQSTCLEMLQTGSFAEIRSVAQYVKRIFA